MNLEKLLTTKPSQSMMLRLLEPKLASMPAGSLGEKLHQLYQVMKKHDVAATDAVQTMVTDEQVIASFLQTQTVPHPHTLQCPHCTEYFNIGDII